MRERHNMILAAAMIIFLCGPSYGQDVKWQKYSNKEYGYYIKYPSDWKVTVAGPRKDDKAAYGGDILLTGELHKVSFTDTSDGYWQAALSLRVIQLPKGRTFAQWLNEYQTSDTTEDRKSVV